MFRVLTKKWKNNSWNKRSVGFLWTSNVKLVDCDVEIDEKDIKKTELTQLQSWKSMDTEKNMLQFDIETKTIVSEVQKIIFYICKNKKCRKLLKKFTEVQRPMKKCCLWSKQNIYSDHACCRNIWCISSLTNIYSITLFKNWKTWSTNADTNTDHTSDQACIWKRSSENYFAVWRQIRKDQKVIFLFFYNIRMEILLIWLFVNILTWIATKLKVSWTYVAIWLSVIGGAVYYISQNYYPTEAKQVLAVLAWIYATSQIVYNLLKKIWRAWKISIILFCKKTMFDFTDKLSTTKKHKWKKYLWIHYCSPYRRGDIQIKL